MRSTDALSNSLALSSMGSVRAMSVNVSFSFCRLETAMMWLHETSDDSLSGREMFHVKFSHLLHESSTASVCPLTTPLSLIYIFWQYLIAICWRRNAYTLHRIYACLQYALPHDNNQHISFQFILYIYQANFSSCILRQCTEIRTCPKGTPTIKSPLF